jgi:hypothetical protein
MAACDARMFTLPFPSPEALQQAFATQEMQEVAPDAAGRQAASRARFLPSCDNVCILRSFDWLTHSPAPSLPRTVSLLVGRGLNLRAWEQNPLPGLASLTIELYLPP